MIRKLSAAVLLASALTPVSLYALGLGELHTRSALNQPFNGDIDLLSVTKGEIDGIKVKLADPKAFSRAGVERPYALSRLRFKPMVLPNGKTVIHITSKDPIREPFLDFLVEVNWPSGRLLREYTVLLDPPVTLARRPAPVEKARAGGRAKPVSKQPVRSVTPRTGERVGPVRAGDTLWGIAERTRYPDVSVEQMALAYFDTNPPAFKDGDINKLKQGAELTVPTHEKASELGRRAARERFLAEANAWRNHGAVAGRGRGASSSPGGGHGTAKPKLVISATRPDGLGEAGVDNGDTEAAVARVKQELLLAREQNAEIKLENEGLRNHITELEEQLAKLTRLITLKNEQLAKIQAAQLGLEGGEAKPATESGNVIDQAIEGQRSEAASQSSEGGEHPVVAETAEAGAEQAASGNESMASAGGGQEGTAETNATVASGETVSPGEAPVGEATERAEGEATERAETAASGASGETVPPAGETPVARTGTPAKRQAEPGLIQSWLDDPMKLALPAGGVLAALLGVWALLRRRRRGEDDRVGPESILIEPDQVQDTELLASQAEAPMTGSVNETSFLSDFSPSEIDALQDETGEVDPLSEADVYMAYGRYQQAEDLIRDALNRNPDRHALKFKLAEIHYATRDTAAFESLIESMAEEGLGAENPEGWQRLLSMGKSLDPTHPLFKDAEDLPGEEGGTGGDPLGGAGLAAAGAGMAAGAAASSAVGLDATGQDKEVDSSSRSAVASRDSETRVSKLDDEEMLELDALADETGDAPSAAPLADDDFADLMDEDSIVIDLPGDLSALGDEDSILKASSLHDSLLVDETPDDKPFSLDEVDDSSLMLDDDSLLKELDLPSGDANEMATGDASVDSMLSTLSEFSATAGVDLEKLDDTTLSPASEMLELDSSIDDDYDEIDEVSTKLDLARAYLEMGDKDGARGILDEVMAEGDDFQKETAQKIIAELG